MLDTTIFVDNYTDYPWGALHVSVPVTEINILNQPYMKCTKLVSYINPEYIYIIIFKNEKYFPFHETGLVNKISMKIVNY